MNKTIIRIMVAAAGMLALAGCNNEDVIRTDVDAGSITIQATTGQMTKVTYSGTSGSFEAGDCISVYGWTGSADSVPAIREVNNVKNRLAEDGKWNAESRMVWNSTTDKYYFLGIYPVRKVTNFKADDYTLYPADSTASDLLIATNLTGVKAADGPVELEFRHALAKLTVNLKIRNEFGATPAMATVAANAKVTATVNYLTGKLTPTGSAQAVSLTALTRVADGYMQSFSGLQVPQDIRIITVTIGGRMYKYEAATDISLCAGKHTTLGLIVGKDRIELEGATVAEWATGTDLAGGVADLVDPYNGHAYVDLGLPSGLKWATCNVGASKPEEYGDYFAWGDTVPYYEPGHAQDDLQTYGKDDKKKTDGYDWSTYKWCEGSYNTLTKYCSEVEYDTYGYNGFTDTKTTLEAEDDAASYNWGGSWHMPTQADWQELQDNCKWDRIDAGNTEFGGIAGFKVTSQKEGYKDRFIFLPAAGYRYGTSLSVVGYGGSYWSSSLITGTPDGAWYIGFYSSNVYANYGSRYYGQSVRPVCP